MTKKLIALTFCITLFGQAQPVTTMGTTKEEYNSGLKKYALIISFLGIIAILFQLSVVYNLFYYFT